MPSTIPAHERPILVVGASGAIGSAVARALGETGHSLGLHYCSNRASVDSTLNEISRMASAYPLRSNLATVEDCEALVEDFFREAGGIFGIALCTGKVPWKQWQETDRED